LTISLPPAVVADANTVLSALIGGRARVVIAASRPRCFATDVVAREIAHHLPALAAKRGLDPTLLFATLEVMPVEWRGVEVYEQHREDALGRIGDRDPDDWPTLALALTLDIPIWSQDKDFENVGFRVLSTRELLDLLEHP
jgi:predicted nucleic acid-binding protein